MWSRIYACSGILTLALYVAASVALSQSPAAACRALLATPGYLLFKLRLARGKRHAALGQTSWVRTARNAASAESPGTTPERLG